MIRSWLGLVSWLVVVGVGVGTWVLVTGAEAGPDESRLLVTALSIILAVVSLQLSRIGTVPLGPGGWRYVRRYGERQRDLAVRYAVLLAVYLVAIALLVLAALTGHFRSLALFVATTAFVASMYLPFAIARHEIQFLEQQLGEHRRKAAGRFRPKRPYRARPPQDVESSSKGEQP